MRGKKPYNSRNIEAHLHTYKSIKPQLSYYEQFPNNVGRNIIFQTNVLTNIVQTSEQQRQNEYINAKFGVSKYASNLVSGKMFKNIL